MRRSNDCVTGCRRNTEGPGNEREARLWLVETPTAMPRHAESFTNSELEAKPV